MHIVVTGADGFVGRVLVQRLLNKPPVGLLPGRISATDLHFSSNTDSPIAARDSRLQKITGGLNDITVIERLFAVPVDAVIHLASMPGGAAEKNYALGRQINLETTLMLLDACKRQVDNGHLPPSFVFASTVAVYGETLPAVVNDHTLPAPVLSYGTHKLASEFLIADASRKGWVRGCSLRLPGVVARPGTGVGLMSAFMSQLFWKLANCETMTMPVSARGQAWWISAKTCVSNLLHALCLPPEALNPQRSYAMPALHLRMETVVQALAKRYGENRLGLVIWQPDPLIERLFATLP
jgi:D-erythronate 2-dehydrogenase